MTQQAIMTILGCGGSGGTPLATGHWGKCDPQQPRNRRTRAAVAIRTTRTSVVIDCGPDFREQTLRCGIGNVDAVLFTHPHGDHANGIDDLRYAAIKQRALGNESIRIPIYADDYTMNDLQSRFHYMFQESADGLYVPLVEPNLIKDYESITIGDILCQSFVQQHGHGRSLGYRIGDVAYSTDVSGLDDKALDILKGIRVWVVDCGQYGADYTTVHANYTKVMAWNDVIKAEHLYLTHLTPRCDYDVINAETPDYVECAYDGLEIPITL